MKKLLLLLVAVLLASTSVFAADTLEVKRAVLCTAIADREPSNPVTAIDPSEQVVFFFNEVANGAGKTITHRWLYNDIEMASVPLKIGSDRWRTWSSKQVWHLLPGVLKVQVLDENGNVLDEQALTINNKEDNKES